MNERQSPRWRFYLTTVVILAEAVHLIWEHLHGGVRSHHILNRADLPAISNLWGIVLLPALTWFLAGRTQRRMGLSLDGKAPASRPPASVIAGFTGPLVVGISLSVAFTTGQESVASYLFLGLFLLSLLLPVYRAECLLGFVLGMTFTFGAVLPTAIGSLLAAISAAVHLGVRPVLVRLWRWLRRR